MSWHHNDTGYEAYEPVQFSDWIRCYQVTWRPEHCRSGVTTIQERLKRLQRGEPERTSGTVTITVQNDAAVLARAPFVFAGHFASLEELQSAALEWGGGDMRPCRINDTVMFDALTGADYRTDGTSYFRVEQATLTGEALLLTLRHLEAWNAGFVPTMTILDNIPAWAVRFTARQEYPRRQDRK